MKSRSGFDAFTAATLAGICLTAGAQTAPAPAPPISALQLEADYRVIAARCGTPAFEKAFYFHSRAVVAAGLVVKGRDPAEVEKSITALRRSPFVLVAAPADCPAQLALLKDLQKTRGAALGKARTQKSAGR